MVSSLSIQPPFSYSSNSYPSNRSPHDATMKLVDAPSARSSPSDLGSEVSDGRCLLQGPAPHAYTGIVGLAVYSWYISVDGAPDH